MSFTWRRGGQKGKGADFLQWGRPWLVLVYAQTYTLVVTRDQIHSSCRDICY